MSESGAFVTGGGGFVRVRDNANAGSYQSEFNRQQKIAEENQRLKQQKQDWRDAKLADEEAKQKASREADAVRAFREYHNNPKSRGGLGSIYRYTEARFGRCYDIELKQGLAELNSPELLRQYMPERFAQQQGEAELKSDYAKHPKCRFCRIVFFTDEELAAHQRTTKPCPKCQSVCSSGGQTHRCSVYGGSIVEDRVPEVKYETGEE